MALSSPRPSQGTGPTAAARGARASEKGVVFGPNATVDVSGSFHAASADYVRMSDGARFQATNPSVGTFSAAPPAAFGFLTATPAAITINGSNLGPVQGTLGLIGGPVTIAGGSLSAPGGTIQVASAAGTGEVPIDAPTGSTVTSFGPVSITGGATLDASNGGSVHVRAGRLSIDSSQIDADNLGLRAGGQIVLNVDTAIALQGGADVHASSLGPGPGGSVSAQAADIKLAGSFIRAQARGAGNAGTVAIVAGTLRLVSSSQISSSTFNSGNAGNITITAGPLLIDGSSGAAPTGVFSQALPRSGGAAGAIEIGAASLTIVDRGKISTGTFGSGTAGSIGISVGGALTILGATPDNPDFRNETGILSRSEPGAGGDSGSISVAAGGSRSPRTQASGARPWAPAMPARSE
jgi:hypothetical protein